MTDDDPKLNKAVNKFVKAFNVPMEDVPGLIDKSFGEFVDTFLESAETIFKTLEAETEKSQYQLIGNTISVAIRRLPYKEGTGKGGTSERRTEDTGKD